MKFSKLTPHSVARHTPSPMKMFDEYCDKCGFHHEHCTCLKDLERRIIETQDELEELQEEYKVLTGYQYRGEIK